MKQLSYQLQHLDYIYNQIYNFRKEYLLLLTYNVAAFVFSIVFLLVYISLLFYLIIVKIDDEG